MIFGDASRFSVVINDVERSGAWVYGSVLFCAGDRTVGDVDDAADLKGVRNWMREALEQPVDRFDPRLRGLSAEQLLETLLTWREDPITSGLPSVVDTYSRFWVAHLGMSSFDRFDIVLVEDPKSGLRLVWREGDDGEIVDITLSPNEFWGPLQDCVDWLSELDAKP